MHVSSAEMMPDKSAITGILSDNKNVTDMMARSRYHTDKTRSMPRRATGGRYREIIGSIGKFVVKDTLN